MEGKIIQVVTWDTESLVVLTDQGKVYQGYNKVYYDDNKVKQYRWIWEALDGPVEVR